MAGKQYTFRAFAKLLKQNGYFVGRKKGSHVIYINEENKHISVPYGKSINAMLAQRLIKENNLTQKG